MTQIRHIASVTIVDWEGNISIGESSKLREVILGLIKEGRSKVILKLKKTAFIDSSGLGELVANHLFLHKAQGALKLLNPPEKIMRLLMRTKLYTVFDVYYDEAAAVKSFERD